jgi:hypothetical protein
VYLGGLILTSDGYTGPTTAVDIFDYDDRRGGRWYSPPSNTWPGRPRADTTGISAGRKCIFAGGTTGTTPIAFVDVYDAPTGIWSVFRDLSVARRFPSGAFIADAAYGQTIGQNVSMAVCAGGVLAGGTIPTAAVDVRMDPTVTSVDAVRMAVAQRYADNSPAGVSAAALAAFQQEDNSADARRADPTTATATATSKRPRGLDLEPSAKAQEHDAERGARAVEPSAALQALRYQRLPSHCRLAIWPN